MSAGSSLIGRFAGGHTSIHGDGVLAARIVHYGDGAFREGEKHALRRTTLADMSAPVRVGFRRSGGLAGITIAADTDTNQLSPAQGETIRALLPGPDSPLPSAPGAPDRFTYELQIDDGEHRRVLRWPETAVPDDVRPLIAELTARSRPIP